MDGCINKYFVCSAASDYMKNQNTALNAKQCMCFHAFSLNCLRATLAYIGSSCQCRFESRGIDSVGNSQVGAVSGGFFGQIEIY